MTLKLPDLPFDITSLEPFASPESLSLHYDKHHRAYHDQLKTKIEGTRFERMPLAEIVQQADGEIFTDAAQIWNHNFYWKCLSADSHHHPRGALLEAIETDFGSFHEFQLKFEECAIAVIGSGWTWLLQEADGSLKILNTRNADTPKLDVNTKPLLTIDVWEHAYYIDYRDQRGQYVKNFWGVVNWNFVERNFDNSNE